MSRYFTIEPSALAARKILRLQLLMPEVIIDPAIVEMASAAMIPKGDLNGLAPAMAELAQDLVDHNLRIIVSMPNNWLRKPTGYWIDAFIVAARFLQVTDVVIVEDCDQSVLRARLKEFRLWGISSSSFGDDIVDIPRDAVLLCPYSAPATRLAMSRNQLAGSLIAMTMDFERTVIVADSIGAATASLYPNMPSQRTALNNRSTLGASCADKTTKEMAVLFATSFAISRYDPVPQRTG